MLCVALAHTAWAAAEPDGAAPASPKAASAVASAVTSDAATASPGQDGTAPAPPHPMYPEALRQGTCLGCHSNPDLRAVTERGAGLKILIPKRAYERSVHGNMDCVVCHAPKAEEADFKVIPHTMQREALPSCMNCHDKAFDHIRKQMGKSRHFEKQGAKITCVDCHDPHTQQHVTAMDSYTASVEASNAPCIACHTSAIRFKELTGKAVYTQNISHDFLPYRDQHFASVRCVECHTPTDGDASAVHRILPKEESLRDCRRCHKEEDSFFVSRVTRYTDVQLGGGAYLRKGFFDDKELLDKMRKADITPGDGSPVTRRIVPRADVLGAFGDAYVPGLGQTSGLDHGLNVIVLAVLLALVLHGLLRIALGRRSGGSGEETAGERVYPLTVRVLHWTNALLFLILLATGMSIHYPAAALSLPMESSVVVHDAAGLLLTVHFVIFILYSLLSGQIRQYLPFGSGMGERFGRQLHYYLVGIFTGAPKPHHTTLDERMNPIQQLTYLLFYCLGMFVVLASGLILLVPELAQAIAPNTSTRWLASAHFFLAMAYLAFLMLHVYMTTTGNRVFSLVKGMITGRNYE